MTSIFLATDNPRRFKKSIICAGDYQHPVTGQKFSFSEADVLKLGTETARFIGNGNQCGFPDGHDGSALKNLGWWLPGFFVDGGWLWGVVEVQDTAVADAIRTDRIKFTSPRIVGEWTDAKGQKYGPLMLHICGTPTPVIPGQGGFEIDCAISMDGVVAAKKEGHKMKNIAAALGLDLAATEDQIVDAIKKNKLQLSAGLDAANAKLDALTKELSSARKTASDEFLASIEAEAVKLGCPIAKEKIAKVQALFDAGLAANAKELGGAYLDVARAEATKKKDCSAQPEDKGKSAKDEAEQKRKSNQAYAEMMRATGYDVKLSSDGQKVEEVKQRPLYQPTNA